MTYDDGWLFLLDEKDQVWSARADGKGKVTLFLGSRFGPFPKYATNSDLALIKAFKGKLYLLGKPDGMLVGVPLKKKKGQLVKPGRFGFDEVWHRKQVMFKGKKRFDSTSPLGRAYHSSRIAFSPALLKTKKQGAPRDWDVYLTPSDGHTIYKFSTETHGYKDAKKALYKLRWPCSKNIPRGKTRSKIQPLCRGVHGLAADKRYTYVFSCLSRPRKGGTKYLQDAKLYRFSRMGWRGKYGRGLEKVQWRYAGLVNANFCDVTDMELSKGKFYMMSESRVWMLDPSRGSCNEAKCTGADKTLWTGSKLGAIAVAPAGSTK
ncbi:MAG: hypothetical protein KC502_22425 [Myxococcales bacterium]|nr:hypothetical protein [Myxococcales bacterium]